MCCPSRELHSQQSAKTDSLETKLQEAETELKGNQALLFERANQISALQRDVHHSQSRLSALEESLQVERQRQAKLESQMVVSKDKVTTLMSESAVCRQEAEFAQRRVEEKERNAVLSQQRFDVLLSTLKTEYEKVFFIKRE